LFSLFITYSSQVVFLRKASLSVFSPVADLSAISKSGAEGRSMEHARKREVAIMSGAGGVRVLGDEWADHVVKVRDMPLTCVASSDPMLEPWWDYPAAQHTIEK
jgi:hypothetical protein